MPPKSRSQGESRQGLIITLVFFILMTIGLGVATYFGFSEQEKYDKAAKDANAKLAVVEKDRDWYKFQALYYRSVMGEPPNADLLAFLGTRKEQFDGDRLPAGTDKEDVRKLIKENLDQRFRWNAKENRPDRTFKDELEALKTKYDQLEVRNRGLQKDVADARDKLQKRDEELREAQKTYDTKLAELSKKSGNEFGKFQDDLKAFRDQVESISESRKKDQEKAEQDKKSLLTQMKKKDEDVAHMRKHVKDLEDRLAALQPRAAEAVATMRTDWKIIRMDRGGNNPYINLGSADRVQPQLTFNVYGVTVDGRVNPEPKGTLEVVNVLGDHLSQARVTSVRDRNRDPILEGDVIFNPSWNPGIQKHIAIAGRIDLAGDGRDHLDEFIRNLQRQNIVVDAWIDTRDGNIKGKGITFRTDYLILGDVDFGDTPASKLGENEQKILANRKKLEQDAAKYGVASMGLLRYLEMIGYRLPRGTAQERPSLYNPDLRPEQAPRLERDKAPPPMRPDK